MRGVIGHEAGPKRSRRAGSRGVWGLGLFLFLAATLLIPLFVLTPASPLDAAPHHGVPPPAHAPLAPTSGETYPTAIRHVFVIYLENNELSNVQSNGPYEMGLAKNYTQASNYYAPCHPSAPE
ncbi:MAG TPA: hypothetical protein VGS23_00720, partial [Thermoplasmata archaeon]|nr:hypothetical protein [Thermoplasmata archaeon]